MYDALLDELEDDRTPNTDEAVELADKAVDVDDDEVPDDVVCELDPEDDGEPKAEDLLLSVGDDHESWSDDPVRMYLTQMGEIPLLTRQQEIALAKEIEITRARFRRKLLECDFVIQHAVKVLKRVYLGELPFDRTVQVSVTDRLEKEQILGRFPHNLKTVEILLKPQQARLSLGDQEVAAHEPSAAKPGAAWGVVVCGPCDWSKSSACARSASSRSIKTLEEFSRRVDELKAKIEASRKAPQPGRRAPAAGSPSFRSILRATQETSHQPAPPRRIT